MGFYGIDNPNPTTAQFSNPRRGGNKLSGTCIVHTAEMYGALNTAAFCMRRSDYGCYHTIVDDKIIIEVYPYEYETWQDSETNNWAVGISAACDAADWNVMGEAQREGYYRNLAFAAADFVTYMKDTYSITVPLRRITGQEARNRVPGFAAHGDSGIARTDPGPTFDWAKFFRYTQEYLNGGAIAPQSGTTTPSEDDEMSGEGPRILQILEAFETDRIREKIIAIDQRTAILVNAIKYVKGKNEPTLYQRMPDGTLRGISYDEWKVTNIPYVEIDQEAIDLLLK